MMTPEEFRVLALGFEAVAEEPHFEKTSFRVKGKIFATMNTEARSAVLKLTEMQQADFGAWDRAACFPVPNKWGKQGWTVVSFEKIGAEFATDILLAAYCNVAPKSLAAQYADRG